MNNSITCWTVLIIARLLSNSITLYNTLKYIIYIDFISNCLVQVTVTNWYQRRKNHWQCQWLSGISHTHSNQLFAVTHSNMINKKLSWRQVIARARLVSCICCWSMLVCVCRAQMKNLLTYLLRSCQKLNNCSKNATWKLPLGERPSTSFKVIGTIGASW